MAVSDGQSITVVKDMGLVSNAVRRPHARGAHRPPRHRAHALLDDGLEHLAQRAARLPRRRPAEFALGHNGNLVNTEALADGAGMLPGTVTSDSDLIAELLAPSSAGTGAAATAASSTRAATRCCPSSQGAFSLVLMDEAPLIGVRDPQRLPAAVPRPRSTAAGCSPREIARARRRRRPLRPRARPGRDGRHRRQRRPRRCVRSPTDRIDPKLCLFEFVLLRPSRRAALRPAACTRPASAWASSSPSRRRSRPTWSMGVPESASPPPRASRRRSGIPYGHGLVKNRYIGRTFIAPSQELRALGVRMKLNPLRENIAGQAARRRRRLDRPRHHHAGDRHHAPRSGRGRDPLAGLVAAVPLAVLLRHGHRQPWRAPRREPRRRRDPRLPRRRLARVPRSRSSRSRRPGA